MVGAGHGSMPPTLQRPRRPITRWIVSPAMSRRERLIGFMSKDTRRLDGSARGAGMVRGYDGDLRYAKRGGCHRISLCCAAAKRNRDLVGEAVWKLPSPLRVPSRSRGERGNPTEEEPGEMSMSQ